MSMANITDDRQCPSISTYNASIAAGSFPAGPSCSLSTTQPQPSPGAIINASWATASGFADQIEWVVNGSPYVIRTKAPGVGGDSLDTTGFAQNSTVMARVRRTLTTTSGVVSASVSGTSKVITRAQVNAALVGSDIAAPTNQLATKAAIMAARSLNGTFGSNSNTITLGTTLEP